MSRVRTCACAGAMLLASGCTFASDGGSGSVGLPADASSSSSDTTAAVDAASTAADDTSAAQGSSGWSGAGTDSGTASETTANDGTTGASGGCDKALFVSAELDLGATIDVGYRNRLLALGFEITVVQDTGAGPEDVTDQCIVLISGVASSSVVADEFRDVAVPVVLWERRVLDDMDYVADEVFDTGAETFERQISFIDPAHPLAAGFAGDRTVYDSSAGEIGWGDPEPAAQIVATIKNQPDHAAVFAYEAGAQMSSGFVAPARRVYLPMAASDVAAAPIMVDLFEAAVVWASQ